MSNIGIIGASSFLGSYMIDRLDATSINGRFEDSIFDWLELSNKHNKLDTVVILARACKKQEPRRDQKTMSLEISGLVKILSVFSDRRVIFASTKSIDPDERNVFNPVSREDVTKIIEISSNGHLRNQTINLPNNREIKNITTIDDNYTDGNHVYAMTKICGEILVKNCCKDYTILRIWDITQ